MAATPVRHFRVGSRDLLEGQPIGAQRLPCPQCFSIKPIASVTRTARPARPWRLACPVGNSNRFASPLPIAIKKVDDRLQPRGMDRAMKFIHPSPGRTGAYRPVNACAFLCLSGCVSGSTCRKLHNDRYLRTELHRIMHLRYARCLLNDVVVWSCTESRGRTSTVA